VAENDKHLCDLLVGKLGGLMDRIWNSITINYSLSIPSTELAPLAPTGDELNSY
jgi:hypothetical protein